MLIAVARAEHLPEWLFPNRRTPPFSGASLRADYLTQPWALWEALGGTTSCYCGDVPTHCNVGYAHNATTDIQQLSQLAPEFVNALATLSDAERWRVAQRWATALLGRRPNDAQLSEYKAHLRELSAFTQQAVANDWLVVFA